MTSTYKYILQFQIYRNWQHQEQVMPLNTKLFW